MRRLLQILAVLALVAIVVVGVTQASGGGGSEPSGGRFDLADAKRRLAGAPAPLAALHADANALLPGGTKAFDARMAALRGYPVVVNKWASWCGPCQVEFPYFQAVATRRGKQIAFVGLDSEDDRSVALTFLRDNPVPFPSFDDPDGRIAARYARTAFPTTVFVDEQGETAYLHQGQYRSERDLEADIDRYLPR